MLIRHLIYSLGLVFCLSFGQAQQERPSFRNMVAVGDSLAAGFQSLSLNQRGQNASFPSVIARQVGTYMFLPLITQPGIPNELVLVDPGPPPVLEPLPGPSGTRVFPTIIPQNLAVVGQTTLEALTVRPGLPIDSLADIILGVPSLVIPQLGIPPLSQIETAYAMQPTFTVFWLGTDDLFRALYDADPSLITPSEVFRQAYSQAVGAILLTGSKLIIANIPDVSVIPFLTPAEDVAALAGVPLELVGPVLGIAPGDAVTAFGLPLVPAILGGTASGPLPPNVVLTAAETQQFKVMAATMNGFISQLAATFGVPLVDAHRLLRELDEQGVMVGSFRLTTDYLGGIFSLDGVHPTDTAHGLIANAFIAEINRFYGLGIPPADLESIAAKDPNFPPNLGVLSGRTLLSMDESFYSSLNSSLKESGEAPERGELDPGTDPVDSSGRDPLAESDSWFRLPSVTLVPGPVPFRRPEDAGKGRTRQ